MASRVEQFTALVAGQPDNALFRFSLAQSLVGEGRTAEAILILKSAWAAGLTG